MSVCERTRGAVKHATATKRQNKHRPPRYSDVRFSPQPAQASARSPSSVTPSFRAAHVQGKRGEDRRKSTYKTQIRHSYTHAASMTNKDANALTFKSQPRQALATARRGESTQPFVRHSLFQIYAFTKKKRQERKVSITATHTHTLTPFPVIHTHSISLKQHVDPNFAEQKRRGHAKEEL